MGTRLAQLVDRIREAKGPFFVARIYLRVNVRIDDNALDTVEAERAILDACRELGFDPGAQASIER